MATILLVEDEPALAQIITQTLEKNGYRVLHASNGRVALQLSQQHKPVLIILDWALLALYELDVLHTLRQVSSIPVLMLTARGTEANSLISLDFSADDYLAKPFSARELVSRVQMLLRRVERVQQIVGADRERHTQPLVYQNLILDADQRRVTVEGQPVELSPIEFDLLYLLLSNPGRVFSSAYLREMVWKDSYAQDDRLLEDAMLHLCQKLGADELIETVFGIGYRLKSIR